MEGVTKLTDKPRPRTLYKFRSWSDEKHKKLLTERKLWVPCANKLNDPFDCSIPHRYDQMARDDLVERLVRLIETEFPDESKTSLRSLANKRIDDIGVYDPSRRSNVLMAFAQRYRDEYGVLSFATEVENPLLWSHYADHCRGFCVGVDSNQLHLLLERRFDETKVSSPERWITYASDYPLFIPTNDEDEDYANSVRSLTTKSHHWEYEKEYRYVFSGDSGFPLVLGPTCVSEVVVGSEMPPPARDEVVAAVKEQFPAAKLLQAVRTYHSYEFRFEDIDL